MVSYDRVLSMRIPECCHMATFTISSITITVAIQAHPSLHHFLSISEKYDSDLAHGLDGLGTAAEYYQEKNEKIRNLFLQIRAFAFSSDDNKTTEISAEKGSDSPAFVKTFKFFNKPGTGVLNKEEFVAFCGTMMSILC